MYRKKFFLYLFKIEKIRIIILQGKIINKGCFEEIKSELSDKDQDFFNSEDEDKSADIAKDAKDSYQEIKLEEKVFNLGFTIFYGHFLQKFYNFKFKGFGRERKADQKMLLNFLPINDI